jgi:anti-sigma factor RsiW
MHKRHLTEDDIEKYAMGKMTESEAAPTEEHLLVCQQCRDELELLGLIIAGLREECARPPRD